LAPDCWISSAQIGVSRASTSRAPRVSSRPGLALGDQLLGDAGSAIDGLISRCRRSTISAGVPAGA
jgi:hypothetical protein